MDRLSSGVPDLPGQHGKTLSLKKKIQKLVRGVVAAPVVLATREADVGGSLKPGKWSLQ